MAPSNLSHCQSSNEIAHKLITLYQSPQLSPNKPNSNNSINHSINNTTTNGPAEPASPPKTPSAWEWKCCQCRRIWNMAITRRCLSCSHHLCLATPEEQQRRRTQPPKSRGKGNSRRQQRTRFCRTEFDYAGWRERNAWRREQLAAQRGLEDAEKQQTRRSLRVRYRGDEPVSDAAATAATRAEALAWLAERQRRKMDRARQRAFADRTHDCWRDCDFPSECMHAFRRARAGTALGSAARRGATGQEREVSRSSEAEKEEHMAEEEEEEREGGEEVVVDERSDKPALGAAPETQRTLDSIVEENEDQEMLDVKILEEQQQKEEEIQCAIVMPEIDEVALTTALQDETFAHFEQKAARDMAMPMPMLLPSEYYHAHHALLPPLPALAVAPWPLPPAQTQRLTNLQQRRPERRSCDRRNDRSKRRTSSKSSSSGGRSSVIPNWRRAFKRLLGKSSARSRVHNTTRTRLHKLSPWEIEKEKAKDPARQGRVWEARKSKKGGGLVWRAFRRIGQGFRRSIGA